MIILEAQHIYKRYFTGFKGFRREYINALDDISFQLYEGEVLAFVGETSSGKTTLARVIAGAEAADDGDLLIESRSIEHISLQQRFSQVRMIFQNPTTSLNPKLRIGQQLEEPLKFSTNLSVKERQQTVHEVLTKVGLLIEQAEFYPHMISMGQKQRINIARAIILRPKVIIVDSSLFALDIMIKNQIIDLLLELKNSFNLSLILISHDPHTIRHISDRIAILQQGKIVEINTAKALFEQPATDYTKRLIG
jgi:cationic peptide transport system ATP-binding protein